MTTEQIEELFGKDDQVQNCVVFLTGGAAVPGVLRRGTNAIPYVLVGDATDPQSRKQFVTRLFLNPSEIAAVQIAEEKRITTTGRIL